MKNKWKFLDSDTLKIIAIVTMLIDHIGAAILLPMRITEISIFQSRVDIYSLSRMIGRTAFPIFVFLLVEGFYHTRSRKKYFGRLVLFALLSELPFDLAFHGVLFYRNGQNVFWTLSIGFLVIWGMEGLYKRYETDRVLIKKNEKPMGCRNGGMEIFYPIVVCVAAVELILAGGAAATFLKTDYGSYGVWLIVLFYLGKRSRVPQILTCIGGYLLFLWEPECIGGFLLILFYNGMRKKRGKGFQYFFYLFYPVHLLILGLLRVAFLGN